MPRDFKDYDEAIENARNLLVDAMLGDVDELIEEGHRLDAKVKTLVFAVARRMLVKLYETAKATVVDRHKRSGLTVERRKALTFKPRCSAPSRSNRRICTTETVDEVPDRCAPRSASAARPTVVGPTER